MEISLDCVHLSSHCSKKIMKTRKEIFNFFLFFLDWTIQEKLGVFLEAPTFSLTEHGCEKKFANQCPIVIMKKISINAQVPNLQVLINECRFYFQIRKNSCKCECAQIRGFSLQSFYFFFCNLRIFIIFFALRFDFKFCSTVKCISRNRRASFCFI